MDLRLSWKYYTEKNLCLENQTSISTKEIKMTVRHPEKVNNPISPIKKKPSWIRI